MLFWNAPPVSCGGLASSAPHHREDERTSSPGHFFKHGHRAGGIGVLIGSFLDVLEVGAGFEGVQDWAAEQSSVSAM